MAIANDACSATAVGSGWNWAVPADWDGFSKFCVFKTKRKGLDELLGGFSLPQLAAWLGYMHNRLPKEGGHCGMPGRDFTPQATSGKSAVEPLCSPSRVPTLTVAGALVLRTASFSCRELKWCIARSNCLVCVISQLFLFSQAPNPFCPVSVLSSVGGGCEGALIVCPFLKDVQLD